MFSPDHFIWIGISVVLIALLEFLSSHFKWSFRTCTKVIFGIYVASEIFKIFTHMFPASRWLGEGVKIGGMEGGMYLLPKSLPFQLCSLMIFFLAYLVFGKDERKLEGIKSLVVPVFMIAGPLAILLATCLDSSNTANLFDSFKDPHCGPIQYFAYHAGMIWYGIYLLRTRQVKFGLRAWGRNCLFLAALLFGSIWVNSALLTYEVNFMFTVVPPTKNLPYLNLNHGWGIYMVHYVLLGLILMTLFELRGIIKDIKARKEMKKGTC